MYRPVNDGWAIRRILGLETDADIEVNIALGPMQRQEQIDALVRRYSDLLQETGN